MLLLHSDTNRSRGGNGLQPPPLSVSLYRSHATFMRLPRFWQRPWRLLFPRSPRSLPVELFSIYSIPTSNVKLYFRAGLPTIAAPDESPVSPQSQCPYSNFSKQVTSFPISHQTYYPISELGTGTFHFELTSTFDGQTFNRPVYQKASA